MIIEENNVREILKLGGEGNDDTRKYFPHVPSVPWVTRHWGREEGPADSEGIRTLECEP